jgi:hypothetical protein
VKSGFARICSVVLLAGCGGTYSSPTAPTTPTVVATTSNSCFPIVGGCLPLAPPAASRALTGVVADAAGRPVAGASVVAGRIGDAFCAGLGYGGLVGAMTDRMGRPPCQRFAVTIPRSGTLEASISASVYEFDVDIVNPDGTFAAYIGYPYRTGPPRITASVNAGSVYEIRLAGAPTDFELTTTLR